MGTSPFRMRLGQSCFSRTARAAAAQPTQPVVAGNLALAGFATLLNGPA